MSTVYVIFYSLYGHVYRMAEEVVKGVKEVEGINVKLFQVPELMTEEQIRGAGAQDAKKTFAHVPEIKPDMLAEADGIIFGTPTRYGNMASQMKNLLDQTSGLWMKGALAGKVGSVFASTATQHGGQETTLTSFHTVLLHHGMVIAGVPYTCGELMNMNEITGGTPYGATTLANTDGSRRPSENELTIARFQGKHVAGITKKLHP